MVHSRLTILFQFKKYSHKNDCINKNTHTKYIITNKHFPTGYSHNHQEYTSINVYTMDDLITTAFSKSNQIYDNTTNSWVYEKNITMNVALTAGRAYYIQNYCNSDDRTASLTISKEDTEE